MSGIISSLAGAPSAANTVGGYYTNAASQFAGNSAPALKQFTAEELASLRPALDSIVNQVAASGAAQGITGSGTQRAALGDASANIAASLTGAVAPNYTAALDQYGNIISQMPGAQANAYQDAISNFYTGISDLGSAVAGMPPMAQTPGGNYGGAPQGYQDSSGGYYTQSGVPYMP